MSSGSREPGAGSREPLLDSAMRDWRTYGFEHLVLVTTRTVTALNRLLDIVSLIRTDDRLHVVFTTDPANPAVFHHGIERALTDLRARVIPWNEAVKTRFGLVITASENDRLSELDGPILLVPHGFAFVKYYPNSTVVAGMDPTRLFRDGRVVPTVIGLSHPEQRPQLAASCPEAASRAVVIGDPATDRLHTSRHRAAHYRRRLDSTGRTLILVASTWGRQSTLGRHPRLPERLAAALPVDEYRIVVTTHPGIESIHGGFQLDGWLTGALDAGVHRIASHEWQAALIAADLVLSDEGSLALYAAVADKPLLLVGDGADHTVPGSPLAALAAKAAALDIDGDLRTQINTALADHRPGAWTDVIGHAVDPPGNSAAVLRRLMYNLIDLPEPAEEAEFPLAEDPATAPAHPAALVIGAVEHGDILALQRFPIVRRTEPHEDLPYRHLLADIDQATARQLSAATILCHTEPRDADRTARDLLARWPTASLVAVRADPSTCLIHTGDHLITAQVADEPPPGFDPMLLASLVHVRSQQHRPLTGPDHLRIGNRVVDVQLRQALRR